MDQIEHKIAYLCEDLFYRGRNSVLIYGQPEQTQKVMKAVYDAAKEREEFSCTWHDASAITKPSQFFEPLLRAKYGAESGILEKLDTFSLYELSDLCSREENSQDPNARKLQVIFIDGIEKLFFKMDFDHLDEENKTKLSARDFMERPLPNNFGNYLRAALHQRSEAVFYGTIHDTKGIEYGLTLGNYHYLFYADNFMPIDISTR